jgi:competence protein ComEC
LFGAILRKKFRTKNLFILLLSLLLVFALSFVNFEKFKSPKCEIIVFDVGNADSFLIKTPDKRYVMIDTAHGKFANSNSNFSQADAIMGKYLRDNGIKKLDLLILTHFDADHSGGAIDIMNVANFKNILISKYSEDKTLNKVILNYLSDKKHNFDYAKHNAYVLKEEKHNFSLKTFVASFENNTNQNETSTIVLLSYGEFNMLFMADGGYSSFEKIKKDLNSNKIEILKVGHHGAKNTVSKNMLDILNPNIAIVSTGPNKYGHPAKSTLDILSDNNIKIYRTDTNNAIKLISDKNKYNLYIYDNEHKKFVIENIP